MSAIIPIPVPFGMGEVDLVLYTAEVLVGVTENPPNSNQGVKVEEFLKATGLGGGYPWCAAFVAWVGQKAVGETWPLKKVAGCVSLYDDATAKGLIRETPQRGDIFLRWYPAKNRFAHTGFVTGSTTLALTGTWQTIEGNTSGRGSRDGWGVFSPPEGRAWNTEDRFIRWIDAL